MYILAGPHTGAVVDNLLDRLAPDRHEIVLFDINRYSAKAMFLIDDPGPLTARQWICFLPFHQRIHIQQARRILRELPR